MSKLIRDRDGYWRLDPPPALEPEPPERPPAVRITPDGSAEAIAAVALRAAFAETVRAFIVTECHSRHATTRSVAALYALGIGIVPGDDTEFWGAANAAIRARWPKGLDRVKEAAWAQYEAVRAALGDKA